MSTTTAPTLNQALFDLIPPLSQYEFQALKDDIATDGVRVPLVYDQDGDVVDGKHRLRACNELAIPDDRIPRITKTFASEDEKLEYIFALNVKRRHLSLLQKKEIVAELRAIDKSQEQVARLMGVDQRTIGRWQGKEPDGSDRQMPNASIPGPPDLRISVPKAEQPRIYDRVKRGESRASIAADYKVTPRRIGQIVSLLDKRKERLAKREEQLEKANPWDPVLRWEDSNGLTGIAEESVNLVVADPPYNISTGEKSFKVNGRITNKVADWDRTDPDRYVQKLRDLLDDLARVLAPGGSLYIFIDKALISYLWDMAREAGLQPKNVIVWHKTNPVPNARNNYASAAEFALYGVKPKGPTTFNPYLQESGAVDVARMHNVMVAPEVGGEEKVEGGVAQKPESVIRVFVEVSSNVGDLVLDPFMGTGTTCAVAKKLNRRSMGFESNEILREAVESRIANAKGGEWLG